jgi:hypothetical protein
VYSQRATHIEAPVTVYSRSIDARAVNARRMREGFSRNMQKARWNKGFLQQRAANAATLNQNICVHVRSRLPRHRVHRGHLHRL